MIDHETLCDLEAEQALCGIAVSDLAAADEATAALNAEAFYRESHRRIWAEIVRLRRAGLGCDVVTVADALQESGADKAVSPAYLARLAKASPAPSMVGQYVALVREAHVRRCLDLAAKEARAAARDPKRSLQEAHERVESLLRAATDAAAAGEGPVMLADAMVQAYEHISAVFEGRQDPGIATGLVVLDRWTGGLQRGELTILGGRPSVGKSSLAQQIAAHVARRGGRVYVASAEMSPLMVGLRQLSLDARVDGRKMRGAHRDPLDGDDWARLAKAVGLGHDMAVAIDHRSKDIGSVVARVRSLHAKSRLALVVIDHLQHLRSPHEAENRTQAIGRMAVECKDLAVALDVPVLALSQLNRQAPGGDRKPRLHDLRESGELEQVADTVLLLHRKSPEPPPESCEVECGVAKSRNGEIGTIDLLHHRPTGRWVDALAHKAQRADAG